jgi:hypothetical protein
VAKPTWIRAIGKPPERRHALGGRRQARPAWALRTGRVCGEASGSNSPSTAQRRHQRTRAARTGPSRPEGNRSLVRNRHSCCNPDACGRSVPLCRSQTHRSSAGRCNHQPHRVTNRRRSAHTPRNCSRTCRRHSRWGKPSSCSPLSNSRSGCSPWPGGAERGQERAGHSPADAPEEITAAHPECHRPCKRVEMIHAFLPLMRKCRRPPPARSGAPAGAPPQRTATRPLARRSLAEEACRAGRGADTNEPTRHGRAPVERNARFARVAIVTRVASQFPPLTPGRAEAIPFGRGKASTVVELAGRQIATGVHARLATAHTLAEVIPCEQARGELLALLRAIRARVVGPGPAGA